MSAELGPGRKFPHVGRFQTISWCRVFQIVNPSPNCWWLSVVSRRATVTCVSLAAVGRLAWIDSLDAWNRAQVFIDGTNVVVCQVLVTGPRHDLEKISVDGVRRVRRKAVCSYGSRAIRMKVIKIFAGPENGEKLFNV